MKLTIVRDTGYYGALCKIKILLDGQTLCSISNNETITVDVPNGIHSISAKSGWVETNHLNLDFGTGDKKSLQLARRLKREHPKCILILCGCLAQLKGSELLKYGADLVIGTQYRSRIVSLLGKVLKTGMPSSHVNPLTESTEFEPLYISGYEDHTRAVLKIQEGCRNRCSYCIIPEVRGPIRSRKQF